ncbi:MAG: hypothetical protein KAI43_03945 [Candidatus Aureabacteria bacterium]|nr:hypothetical protein [Candidatus Auribacterota bacterium]
MIKNTNGKEISVKGIKDGILFTELVYNIETWGAENNLIILEILADNIPVDRDDEIGLKKKKYSSSDDIVIKTQKPEQAALTAIREAKKQIPAFEKIIDEIITSQQKGEKEEAINKFSHLLKSVSDIIQLFKVLEQYLPDEFENIQVNNKPIISINREFLEILQETKLAMEDQDFVTINDLLEYEIKPKILEDFLSILEELESKIQSA